MINTAHSTRRLEGSKKTGDRKAETGKATKMPVACLAAVVTAVEGLRRACRGFSERHRGVAANSSEEHERAFLVAANHVPPIDAGAEWLLISPYGDFPHPLGMQKITKAAAETMVAAFNSLVAKAARGFRGLPVYVGHPDVDPERWPDDRRIGAVKALEAREDGFYGKVAWNKRGKENAEEGYHVYPSPAWLFPKNSRGLIEPDELISIGLTNTPQIRDSAPWTNSQPTPDDNPIMSKEMRAKLIGLFGLAENCTDNELLAAAEAASTGAQAKAAAANAQATAETTARTEKERADALDVKLTAANAARETAENAAKAARAAHAKTLLDTAANEGRINPTQRAEYETAFNSDFDAAAVRLAKEAKKLNTKELEIAGTRVAINTSEERKRVIDNAVAEVMAKNGGDFQAAWNSVKGDPRYKAVFEAMQVPGKKD